MLFLYYCLIKNLINKYYSIYLILGPSPVLSEIKEIFGYDDFTSLINFICVSTSDITCILGPASRVK